MHPIIKVIIGAILVIGSVYYIINGIDMPGVLKIKPAISDVKIVINGIIPPLVFLLGIFIIWLELDELRIEKELKTEERRARKRK